MTFVAAEVIPVCRLGTLTDPLSPNISAVFSPFTVTFMEMLAIAPFLYFSMKHAVSSTPKE